MLSISSKFATKYFGMQTFCLFIFFCFWFDFFFSHCLYQMRKIIRKSGSIKDKNEIVCRKSETIYNKQWWIKICIWLLFEITQFKLSIKLSMANEQKKGPAGQVYIDSCAFSNKYPAMHVYHKATLARIWANNNRLTMKGESPMWRLKICWFWIFFFFSFCFLIHYIEEKVAEFWKKWLTNIYVSN